MLMSAETGWRIGTTQVGFDAPYDAVAVYHDGVVVKPYPHAGTILGKLFARIYIWRNR